MVYDALAENGSEDNITSLFNHLENCSSYMYYGKYSVVWNL